jgi:XTP/dITP diphosphohydrolase
VPHLRDSFIVAKVGLFSRSAIRHAIPQRVAFKSMLKAQSSQRLYIATSNPGKLRDFAAAASQHITLTPLPGIKEIPAPAEDESTFEDNARLKAIYYSHHALGEIVIADDSGLEVDVLNGAPGVRSARYAEDRLGQLALNDQHLPDPITATTDERNNLWLLQALSKIRDQNTTARYHCVLAAARDGKILCIGDGTVEGEILSTPRGTGGFGYDSLFYLPDQRKTMAELDIQTKLSFSHRGRAFSALLKALLAPLQPSQIQ